MAVANFKPGDLVFAKLTGYPPWPARIYDAGHEINDELKGRYLVFFFGSHDIAVIGPKNVFPYNECKAKYGGLKKKSFVKAMWEIENDPKFGLEKEQTAAESAKRVGVECTAMPQDHVNADKSIATQLQEKTNKEEMTQVASKIISPTCVKDTEKDMTEGSNSKLRSQFKAKKKKAVTKELAIKDSKPGTKRKQPSSMDTTDEKVIQKVDQHKKRKKTKKDVMVVKITSPKTSPKSATWTPMASKQSATVAQPSAPSTSSKANLSKSNVLSPQVASEASESQLTPSSSMKNLPDNNQKASWQPRTSIGPNGLLIITPFGNPQDDPDDEAFSRLRPVGNQHDLANQRNELRRKYQIATGEFVPKEQRRKKWESLTKEEMQQVRKERIQYQKEMRKRRTIDFVRAEIEMMRIEFNIRQSLQVSKMDEKKCLSHMKDLEKLGIRPLMLKKFPRIVKTIVLCTKFTKSEAIKKQAMNICNKFKAMFPMQGSEDLKEAFARAVKTYNESRGITAKEESEDPDEKSLDTSSASNDADISMSDNWMDTSRENIGQNVDCLGENEDCGMATSSDQPTGSTMSADEQLHTVRERDCIIQESRPMQEKNATKEEAHGDANFEDLGEVDLPVFTQESDTKHPNSAPTEQNALENSEFQNMSRETQNCIGYGASEYLTNECEAKLGIDPNVQTVLESFENNYRTEVSEEADSSAVNEKYKTDCPKAYPVEEPLLGECGGQNLPEDVSVEKQATVEIITYEAFKALDGEKCSHRTVEDKGISNLESHGAGQETEQSIASSEITKERKSASARLLEHLGDYTTEVFTDAPANNFKPEMHNTGRGNLLADGQDTKRVTRSAHKTPDEMHKSSESDSSQKLGRLLLPRPSKKDKYITTSAQDAGDAKPNIKSSVAQNKANLSKEEAVKSEQRLRPRITNLMVPAKVMDNLQESTEVISGPQQLHSTREGDILSNDQDAKMMSRSGKTPSEIHESPESDSTQKLAKLLLPRPLIENKSAATFAKDGDIARTNMKLNASQNKATLSQAEDVQTERRLRSRMKNPMGPAKVTDDPQQSTELTMGLPPKIQRKLPCDNDTNNAHMVKRRKEERKTPDADSIADQFILSTIREEVLSVRDRKSKRESEVTIDQQESIMDIDIENVISEVNIQSKRQSRRNYVEEMSMDQIDETQSIRRTRRCILPANEAVSDLKARDNGTPEPRSAILQGTGQTCSHMGSAADVLKSDKKVCDNSTQSSSGHNKDIKKSNESEAKADHVTTIKDNIKTETDGLHDEGKADVKVISCKGTVSGVRGISFRSSSNTGNTTRETQCSIPKHKTRNQSNNLYNDRQVQLDYGIPCQITNQTDSLRGRQVKSEVKSKGSTRKPSLKSKNKEEINHTTARKTRSQRSNLMTTDEASSLDRRQSKAIFKAKDFTNETKLDSESQKEMQYVTPRRSTRSQRPNQMTPGSASPVFGGRQVESEVKVKGDMKKNNLENESKEKIQHTAIRKARSSGTNTLNSLKSTECTDRNTIRKPSCLSAGNQLSSKLEGANQKILSGRKPCRASSRTTTVKESLSGQGDATEKTNMADMGNSEKKKESGTKQPSSKKNTVRFMEIPLKDSSVPKITEIGTRGQYVSQQCTQAAELSKARDPDVEIQRLRKRSQTLQKNSQVSETTKIAVPGDTEISDTGSRWQKVQGDSEAVDATKAGDPDEVLMKKTKQQTSKKSTDTVGVTKAEGLYRLNTQLQGCKTRQQTSQKSNQLYEMSEVPDSDETKIQGKRARQPTAQKSSTVFKKTKPRGFDQTHTHRNNSKAKKSQDLTHESDMTKAVHQNETKVEEIRTRQCTPPNSTQVAAEAVAEGVHEMEMSESRIRQRASLRSMRVVTGAKVGPDEIEVQESRKRQHISPRSTQKVLCVKESCHHEMEVTGSPNKADTEVSSKGETSQGITDAGDSKCTVS